MTMSAAPNLDLTEREVEVLRLIALGQRLGGRGLREGNRGAASQLFSDIGLGTGVCELVPDHVAEEIRRAQDRHPRDRRRALFAPPPSLPPLPTGADTDRLRLTAITRQRPAGAWDELTPLITHRIA